MQADEVLGRLSFSVSSLIFMLFRSSDVKLSSNGIPLNSWWASIAPSLAQMLLLDVI
jgi:hypothetical protein